MATYEHFEFADMFQRLRLPDQVGKIAEMTRLAQRMPQLTGGRPLSELLECIEEIDRQPDLAGALRSVRAQLAEHVMRGLLTGDPDIPLELAALDREAIFDILPRVGFAPALTDDQIGPASVDLTLGAFNGRKLGTTVEVRKGDLLVLPALEEHAEWPDDVLGRVSVRSGPARQGTECAVESVRHLNSIWIFPGSKGPIQLEILYLGEEPAYWTLGKTRLVQLTFLKILTGSAKAQPVGHGNGRGNGRAQGLTTETFKLEGGW